MKLNREKIQRMFNDRVGSGGSGSGGSGGDMPAGVATQAWTMENFLSIEFFSKLFKAYGPAETEGDPDVEIVPNDVEGEISNIKAMFGFWTEQYISALGQGSGGGGGGGDLNEPLASINTAGLATHPGSAGQTIIWNGSAWVYGSVLNSGVTSVGLSAPTGFNVTGSPITSSGTLALSFASGYELPLAADTAKGVTAYGWGDHSLAGYALASNVYSKTDADAKFLTIAFFRSLFKAYTSASAEVVPNAGDTTTISSIKAMFGFWTEQYISALGQGSGGGGGITLNEPLASLNNASLGSPSGAGQAIVWNGSTWKYSSTAGISTTSLNVGGSASISGALSVAGNISSSAGGFIVSGKDDTYVLLAGGGTKLLSEIGGGGAVNSITIGNGGTNYTPDANGIVTIPSYPSTAHLVSGITVNGGTYTPSSGIVVLPAYPTVPTTISSFTNDSGYITNAALTGYLPLTGGTLYGTSAGLLTINRINATAVSSYTWIKFEYDSTYIGYIGVNNVDDDIYFQSPQFLTSKVWHASNDGAGSGLDADLLDGQHGSYYAAASALTGYLPLTGGTMTGIIYGNTGNGIEFRSNNTGVYKEGIRIYNNTTNNYACITLMDSTASNLFSMVCNTGQNTYYFDVCVSGTTYAIHMPQKNGTIALTSDLSDYLPLAGGALTGNLGFGYGSGIYYGTGGLAMRMNSSGMLILSSYGSNIYFRPNGTDNSAGQAYIDTNGYMYGSFVGSLTGNADTATTLATSRTLWGQPFNGSANVDGKITMNYGSTSYNDSAIAITNNYTTGSYWPISSFTSTATSGARITIGVGKAASNYNSAFIGYYHYADGSTSNFLTLGMYAASDLLCVLGSGNVGIGTTSPAHKLQVNGDVYAASGFYCAADTGFISNNTTILRANSSNATILSSGGNTIHFRPNGSLDAANAMTLNTSGVLTVVTGVYSQGYVTALSDIRKKNVREYMNMDYGIVADAPAIKFVWKDGRCDGKMQVGSIAQYWQRVMPEAVSEMADGELSMSYGVIALLSSIATARKVRDHEQRIQELERENKMLHKRIADLQNFGSIQ